VQAVAAEAVDDEEDVVMVSTAPEELRAELLAKRLATAGAIPNNLLASAGLNLPNRAIVSTTDKWGRGCSGCSSHTVLKQGWGWWWQGWGWEMDDGMCWAAGMDW
jgi:hypothetical protein